MSCLTDKLFQALSSSTNSISPSVIISYYWPLTIPLLWVFPSFGYPSCMDPTSAISYHWFLFTIIEYPCVFLYYVIVIPLYFPISCIYLSDRIQNSLKNNVFWMTQLDLVEDFAQWVWNVHMSLEWRTWVYNYEESI